jgi:preflagellin peptidase FlaK
VSTVEPNRRFLSTPAERTSDVNSALDLVRLLVVPFFAWAAYTDVKTRRIPNKVWPPLFLAGLLLLALTIQRALDPDVMTLFAYDVLPAAVVSLGVVAPIAYLFWLFGGFGGADAKALLVLSLLFPVTPAYRFAAVEFPMYENALGSFAFAILTNTVVLGVLFPAALFAKNAANGEFSLPMFLGERVPVSALPTRHGTVMGTNDGMTAGKLDLDALRMYLRWRGTTLDAIQRRPEELRDPESLPDERNDPGGGEVDHRDAEAVDADHASAPSPGDAPDQRDAPDGDGERTERADDAPETSEDDAQEAFDDPWGAESFLDEIDGDAYGTSPAALRDGLEVLADADAVWVSPGIPFIVPMFLGLLVALTVGDLVTAAIELL